MPAVAPAGVIVPVVGFIANPDGLTEKVPPGLPVKVTETGGLGVLTSSAALHKIFLS